MKKNNTYFPYLGFGLGLRTEHYEELLQTKQPVDWLEVLTENYLVPGGKPLYFLDKMRENYPLVMHGVSLSIGSTDPLDKTYLKELKKLAQRIEPRWISDHLCWTGVKGFNMHDLLPLPYTEEAIKHIVARVQEIQDYLGRPLLLENVSTYLTYLQSEMAEWEFINEIAEKADCAILLDVNNVYVSAINHAFNPLDYIHAINPKRVAQIHLAGHSNQGNYIIDTHDAPIVNDVWELYGHTINHCGPVSTMIERDDNIPPLRDLLAELNQARKMMETSLTAELLS